MTTEATTKSFWELQYEADEAIGREILAAIDDLDKNQSLESLTRSLDHLGAISSHCDGYRQAIRILELEGRELRETLRALSSAHSTLVGRLLNQRDAEIDNARDEVARLEQERTGLRSRLLGETREMLGRADAEITRLERQLAQTAELPPSLSWVFRPANRYCPWLAESARAAGRYQIKTNGAVGFDAAFFPEPSDGVGTLLADGVHLREAVLAAERHAAELPESEADHV